MRITILRGLRRSLCLRRALWLAGLFVLIIQLSLISHAWPADTASNEKDAITTSDSVSMATLDSPADPYAGPPAPYFSPDGKHFAVVLRQANIQKNTNDSSILLYQTNQAFDSPEAEVLVRMSSNSTNRYSIRQVRWLKDNETLVFLGENPGEPSQVYAINIRNKQLRKLTHNPTTVTNYDITSDGSRLAYVAEPSDFWPTPKETSHDAAVVISGQELGNILAGHHFQPAGQQVFWQASDGESHSVAVEAKYFVPETRISWSPSGRYFVFSALIRGVQSRSDWETYDDPIIKQVFASHAFQSRISPLSQYLVFDTERQSVRPLLDTPVVSPFDQFSWAKNGEAVFCSSYLPLDGVPEKERKSASYAKQRVEVFLPSYKYRTVEARDLPPEEMKRPPLEVTTEEGLNTPPKLYVSDRFGGDTKLLLDLNPQFDHLRFGQVRTIEWSVDGVPVLGGLYLPPDYAPGKRYPLVIQTHGFTPDEFSMDGHSEWSSGFAARPLAAKGIVVLQSWKFKDPRDYERITSDRQLGRTAEEAVLKFNALAYERAIDRLDNDGMIDRSRVGIVGFSRTACFVGYTLSHSHYPFAAAVLVDGISCGYFEEIAVPEESRDVNFINGGTAPFGAGLRQWMRNAPGFNTDDVHTPVQLISLQDYSVLTAWEWYVALSLTNKPVDFILVPHGYHIGVKPSQRMLTQQAVVDWFAFWLKGEEDSDPAKVEQNARWHQLRGLSE